MKDKPLAGSLVDKVMESAVCHGAEELITACPLCLYNLRNSGSREKVPVTYLTEILAEALGLLPEEEAPDHAAVSGAESQGEHAEGGTADV